MLLKFQTTPAFPRALRKQIERGPETPLTETYVPVTSLGKHSLQREGRFLSIRQSLPPGKWEIRILKNENLYSSHLKENVGMGAHFFTEHGQW